MILRPSRRADAHDIFLAGQPATIAGVFHDVDGGEHLAVTLDDDPAVRALRRHRALLLLRSRGGRAPVKVLVAGIGNVFFGDDGFGVEVADRLLARTEPWPDGVRVGEYGIRGVHLAYELLDGYDALVLVDALPMGEAPGTVAVLEVDPADADRRGTGRPWTPTR